jgi:signal peptidase II
MTGGVAVPDGLDQPPHDTAEPGSGTPATADVRPSARALVALIAVPVLVVTLDQVVKQLSLAHLSGSPPVRLFGGAVYFNLTRNSGAAYSLGGRFTYVFPIIAVAVIGAIIWLARRLRSTAWAVALGLVLGGAVGNLADRLFRPPGFLRGQVIDMISLFDPNGRVFPAGAIFNLADSALFCGVVLALILELAGRHRDGTRAARHPDRAEA